MGNGSFWNGLKNTFIVVLPGMVSGVFFSSFAAYGFAKIRFRGRGVLFTYLMFTMMIPSVIIMSPAYVLYDMLGWTDTYLPLILPHALGTVSCIFYLRQFFYGIPDELLEAAQIDGLGKIGVFFYIMLPLGKVAVIAQISGEITSIERIEGTMRQEVIITNESESISHKINANQSMRPWVQVGAQIQAGEALTEGPLDPKELLRVAGVREVQDYILKEVKKVYQSQGIEISDKHLEVMIKQMMKKVIVVDSGDTDLNVGVQLSLNNITKINRDALLSGKTPAQFKPVLLGISKASVETDSFLSAASFQETTKVLTDATIKGKVDHLIGLKENVIIGKLIPAGTGCTGNRPQNELVKAKAKELRDKRLARMNEVKDEEFDKIINANALDEEASLNEDVLDHESILGDTAPEAESLDIQTSFEE